MIGHNRYGLIFSFSPILAKSIFCFTISQFIFIVGNLKLNFIPLVRIVVKKKFTRLIGAADLGIVLKPPVSILLKVLLHPHNLSARTKSGHVEDFFASFDKRGESVCRNVTVDKIDVAPIVELRGE